MTSIIFLTDAIYCNFFRSNYLRNEKYLLRFFFRLLNLDSISNILKKEDDPHSWCIFEFTDSEKRG